ncbi:MAG: hypothetical protein K6U79_00100 [Firmicutes bacterium]|nr:hypothetical protein [Bacillota bacterium]
MEAGVLREELETGQERALTAWLEAVRIDETGEPLWPGWRVRQSAVGFYAPSGECVLVGHRNPPGGAHPVFLRDGRVVGPVGYTVQVPARVGGGAAVLPYRNQRTVFLPVEWSGEGNRELEAFVFLIIHQAFHAWAGRLGIAANPVQLLGGAPYPVDEPANNALGNLEGLLLADAVQGAEGMPLERWARAFALVRRERRAWLEDELVAYEQAMELREGPAGYVEWKAMERVLQGYEPAEAFRQMTGQDSFQHVAEARLERLAELRRINYLGRGALRRRFTYSGLGLALILDRLAPGWPRRLLRGGPSLDDLLEEHVAFDGGEGDEALLREVEMRYDYDHRLLAEHEAADLRRRRKEELVDRVLRAPGTLLILDVSRLRLLSATPPAEGERIHDGLTLYARRASFRFDGARVEVEGRPVVHDLRAGLLEIHLDGRVRLFADEEELPPRQAAHFREGLALRMAGLEVEALGGTVQPTAEALYIRLLPPPEVA